MLAEEVDHRVFSPNKGCISAEVWQAPPSNWVKINWDSAADNGQGLVGVGVVERDNAGQVLATMKSRKPLFPDPLLAEALGALEAVQFGLDIGLSQVIIEGDSLQVVTALKSDKESWNSTSMFVNEAKQLTKYFAKWDISHVRRNGN
ncbi:hypothetical protein F2P56_008503 [Juglans regia]|uniref:RNase H type-1 domain-containing protein n=1 Tax=Juglans regia TaxID=51240 RepID=A0A834CYM1_JUGRE|nr:hypothetical protein F2P56_008503 [Juglans regia]